ncbi:unnamed protein product [Brassica oleracea]
MIIRDNEAAMIKKIATDISNILNNFTPSNDFDGLVGMGVHLEKLEPLLYLGSDEVRMIGIWGPPGIGKTTIARVAFNQLSNSFQLSVFMDDLKANSSRLCSDDYSVKLQLQQQFMSQITNHKDMVVSHLGVASNRLKDKKVLVVLDGVDRSLQLDAMAKETWWFGPGSRIIITAQDHRLFRAHGINNIYKVNFPINSEALQIFCTYSFGQKSPKDGFEELAREVTKLAGELPLGLRVMGSYFRGMPKQEWTNSLPRLKTSLDSDIQSILKFSYDALDDDEKLLFLHIACFFSSEDIHRVEEHLENKFLDVRQRLNVLVEKSLISIDNKWGYIEMHSLLEKLGREIGSKSVIGINFSCYGIKEELLISEKAFEGMSNLQFLKVNGYRDKLQLTGGLNYLSHKLRLLEWSYFPMTCFPCIVNLEFLVELIMDHSKLEKLWEGIKSLRCLKWMDLSYSIYLKELPDLSTATNLEKLDLRNCSSLIKLPSLSGNILEELNIVLDLSSFPNLLELSPYVGNSTNLEYLNLSNCLDLVKLPLSFGNLQKLQKLILNGCSKLEVLPTNLFKLNLSNCSNLVEIPLFIENFQKLQRLRLRGCDKLEVLPTNINLESLDALDLRDCSMLRSFPQISANIKNLDLIGTAIEQVPPSIRSWPRLDALYMSYFENLREYPHALERITGLCLTDTEIQEVPPWVKKMSRLSAFVLKGCRKLVSVPPITDSIYYMDASDCKSLEILEGSFPKQDVSLIFANCFKLNQEARDLIIQNSVRAVLPGGQVPACFTHRAIGGGPLTIKLTENPLPKYMTFKACILLLNKGDHATCFKEKSTKAVVMYKNSSCKLTQPLAEHMYTFPITEEVTFSELLFEFKLETDDVLKIGECGLVHHLEVP